MERSLSQQAERAVLSMIFSYPESIIVASDYLKSKYFSVPDYRRIFEACLEVDRQRQEVDVVSVGQQLRDRSHLLTKLVELIEAEKYSPDSIPAKIQSHAAIIRDTYLKREALQITMGLSQLTTGSEVIAEINKSLGNLENDMLVVDEDDRLFGGTAVEEALFPSCENTGCGSDLYPSGISELDKLTGGLEAGTVTALQGLFKSGKSKLLIQILVHNAEAGVPVGFITLDMPRRRVERWIVSHYCRIDSRFFKKSYCDEWHSVRDEYRERVRESNVGALPVFVAERQRPSVHEIGAVIAKWARKGVRLVGIDYFEGMDTGSEWKEEGKVTGGLNNIAVRHNVALIYVDQLNKEAEGAEGPDIRYSRGSVIRCADADTILQIGNPSSRHRDPISSTSADSDKMSDIDMLIVERDGVSGKIIKLRADLSIGQFAGREE